jgi:uncharacterized membrane protein YqjE
MSSSFDTGTGSDRSLGELFSDMTSQLSTLFQKEVQLAQAEIKQEVSKAGQAAGMLAGAAVFALGALTLLAFSLAYLLSEAFDSTSLGFFVVGLLLAVIGGALAAIGRNRLKTIDPKPTQTIETLQEDAQTIRERRP